MHLSDCKCNLDKNHENCFTFKVLLLFWNKMYNHIISAILTGITTKLCTKMLHCNKWINYGNSLSRAAFAVYGTQHVSPVETFGTGHLVESILTRHSNQISWLSSHILRHSYRLSVCPITDIVTNSLVSIKTIVTALSEQYNHVLCLITTIVTLTTPHCLLCCWILQNLCEHRLL